MYENIFCSPLFAFSPNTLSPRFHGAPDFGSFSILAYVGSLYNIQGFVSWREGGRRFVYSPHLPALSILLLLVPIYSREMDGPGVLGQVTNQQNSSPKRIEGEYIQKRSSLYFSFLRSGWFMQAQLTDMLTENRSCTVIYIRGGLPTLSCRSTALFRRFSAKLHGICRGFSV